MTTGKSYQSKYPGEKIDHRWPFAAILDAASDTYQSHTFIEATGDVTIENERVEGSGDVVARLGGGTQNRSYTVICQLTTAGGQVYEGTLTLRIKSYG